MILIVMASLFSILLAQMGLELKILAKIARNKISINREKGLFVEENENYTRNDMSQL